MGEFQSAIKKKFYRESRYNIRDGKTYKRYTTPNAIRDSEITARAKPKKEPPKSHIRRALYNRSRAGKPNVAKYDSKPSRSGGGGAGGMYGIKGISNPLILWDYLE